MEPLTDKEKKLLAVCLIGIAMKGGPPAFGIVESIVNKLEILPEFEYYAKDWIAYKEKLTKEN